MIPSNQKIKDSTSIKIFFKYLPKKKKFNVEKYEKKQMNPSSSSSSSSFVLRGEIVI